MKSYEKILMPTDGSKGSEVAVEHAISLAEKFGAEVHLLYVIDVRTRTTADMWANMSGELREIGKNATESIKQDISEKDIEVEKVVTEGVPHKEITAYADEKNMDIIIMGSHGRTGLDRMLIGSTAEKVVRTSKIPVMTIKRSK